MESRLSANELTLEGTRDEWREFSAALSAGQLIFPLNDRGDAAPYDHLAKRLVIEPTDELVGRFYPAPGPELRFVATQEGLRSLIIHALVMADLDPPSPITPHIHFDWISFGSFLAEGGPDMVLELIR